MPHVGSSYRPNPPFPSKAQSLKDCKMFNCTLLAVFADLDPSLPRSGAPRLFALGNFDVLLYIWRTTAGFCQPPMLSKGRVHCLRRRQAAEVVGLVVFSGLAQMLGRAKSGEGNETSDVEGMPEVAHPKTMGSE